MFCVFSSIHSSIFQKQGFLQSLGAFGLSSKGIAYLLRSCL